MDPEAAAAIDDVARASGAEVFRAVAADLGDRAVGLQGDHQRSNAAVAMRLLEVLNERGIAVSPEARTAALLQANWPGRLDLRRLPDGREVLLDAAHNPAGALALAAYLRAQPGPPLPLVFAAMRDKDAASMFRALAPAMGSLIVTRATHPRSADPGELSRLARSAAPELPVSVESSLPRALETAWRLASPGSRIVVAGSIFLLGDVMLQLGLHC